MRRLYLVLILMMFSLVARSQFLVEESGKTAVGVLYDSDTPLLSKFSINTRGNSKILSDFNATNFKKGLRIQRNPLI